MNKRILTLLSLCLFFAVPLPQVARATYILPPVSNTQGYINSLIQSYNALVGPNPSDNIKGFFSLYHAISNTFEVIVMKSDNTSSVVVLNFTPIGGNTPGVIMDYNDTFLSAYKLFDFQAGNDSLRGITIEYTNTIIPITLAYTVNMTDITGDYMTNSLLVAQSLYRADLRSIPQAISNQPSFSHDLSTCIFAGICGIIGFGIGIVTGVWYIYEKLVRPKPPQKKSRLRRKTPEPNN